MPKKFL